MILQFISLKLRKQSWIALKSKTTHNGNKVKYSIYEVFSAHIWRCLCKPGNLNEDQHNKMNVIGDSRIRLQAPLPLGYFGNGVFMATHMALASDLTSITPQV